MSVLPPVTNSRDSVNRDGIKPLPEEKQKYQNAVPDENEKKETPPPQDDTPYCVLPERQKVSLMLLASFAAVISPISSSIYLPAINDIARDLDVSINLVNLTITTYLVGNIWLTLITANKLIGPTRSSKDLPRHLLQTFRISMADDQHT
jgi:hypothetical protein